MNGKKLFRILPVLLLLVFLPAAALGGYSFRSYTLDVDAMKAMEKEDTFEVRVTKKVVTDDVHSSSLNNANGDMLSLTVENSSSGTVTGVVILAVAYVDSTGEGETEKEYLSVPLQSRGLGIEVSTGYAKRTISTLTMDGLNIGPGTSAILNVPCDHDYFDGVRVLIAQYTDSEGQDHINGLYPEWQELALGSPTIILD